MNDEKAICRWCKRELRGKPYYMGGQAYHPDTGEQCKVNYYGGFVCSEHCDYRSSLELEESMPGHQGQKSLSLGSESYKAVKRNWNKSI
jgi:hypothetical protein